MNPKNTRYRSPLNSSSRAGVGLKPEHYEEILGAHPKLGFFEVHAENYMGDGGPPHHYLTKIRENYPLSVHGVGLSIGSSRPLDASHLARLKAVHDRYEPELFSEHLAWSGHGDTYFPDLLPVPYTAETLSLVVEHIDQVQETLGRPMLLENPATYISFENSEMPETTFLAEIVRQTSCGLLLDINNVFVSATNHGYGAKEYLDDFPMDAVDEIHLAGHATETDDAGATLLIDAHDRPVADPVWDLYQSVVAEEGSIPTLIEWDADVPDWPILFAEAVSADKIMTEMSSPGVAHPSHPTREIGSHDAVIG